MDKTDIKYTEFAEEYLRNGGNARQAYQKVYPDTKDKTADASASRLLKNVKVQKILENGQKQTEQKNLITREGLIAEMNELKLLATADNQLGVVAKVIDMKARMIGAFTDKHEITGANGGAIETVTLDKKEYKKARETMLKDDNL